jgi:PPP family 3-phenylpropionic acid transporter
MTTPAFRFAAYYGSFYFTLGAFLPYFPKWLEGRGLEAEWIGWIMAAGMVGRTLISPLGARWADRSPRQHKPIFIFSLAAAALFVLHIPAVSPWILLALSFGLGATYFGQMPLIDAFAMGEARRGRITFGPVRAIGSALFIVSNLAAGALLDRTGSESILTWIIIGAALVAVSASLLPQDGEPRDVASKPAKFEDLVKLIAGPFGLALAASVFVQSAHGFYYFFSAVAWSADGHSEFVIGVLWASGVVIEIAFLWLSGRGWLAKLSPTLLLIIGASASIARWALTALSPPLWGLFLLQNLHALTFAATYLGFLRYAAQVVPERFSATAQAVNSALAGGIVMAIASAVSGYVFAHIGTFGFASMVLPSFLGLLCALLLSRVSSLPPRGKLH